MRFGYGILAVFLVILAPGCSSLKGKDGNNGKDGRDGQDGSSCQMLPRDGGLAIQCGQEMPLFLTSPAGGANGKDGIDGKDGKDGVSCVLLEKTETSARIACPAQDPSGALVEVTLKNGENGKDGKDGASCSYVSGTSSHHVIRCGAKEFEVRNGSDGRNGTDGTNGTNGRDGEDGQANFSSALLDAVITDEVKVDSRMIRCSSRYQTNDQDFASRTKTISVYVNDTLFGTASTWRAREFQTEASYHEGIMTLSFPIFRDSLQPGDRVSCRNSLFAETYRQFHTPAALTSAANSSEQIVPDSPGRLQKAKELELTGAVATHYRNYSVESIKLLLNNTLAQPANDSQCQGLITVSWKDGAGWTSEKFKVKFTVQAGANETIIKTSPMVSTDQLKVFLHLDCEGDKSYVLNVSEDLTKYALRASLNSEKIQLVPTAQ